MSYILDALRKADRERSLGRVPDLDQTAVIKQPQRERRWLPTAIILILLMNAVLLTWILWPTPGDTDYALAESGLQERAARVVLKQPTSVETAPELPRQSAQSEPGSVPPAPAPVEPGPQPDRIEERTNEPAAPGTAGVDQQTEPAAPKPASPAAEAQPVQPPAATDETELLSLRQLPEDYRSQLPDLDMNVHFYTGDANRRFIIVDGRRYQTGDTLNAGPRLLEIVQTGAVLEYRGRRFLLPASR